MSTHLSVAAKVRGDKPKLEQSLGDRLQRLLRPCHHISFCNRHKARQLVVENRLHSLLCLRHHLWGHTHEHAADDAPSHATATWTRISAHHHKRRGVRISQCVPTPRPRHQCSTQPTHPIFRGNDQDGDVSNHCAALTHRLEQNVPRSIQKSNWCTGELRRECANRLRDTSDFALGDFRLPQHIEQCRFSCTRGAPHVPISARERQQLWHKAAQRTHRGPHDQES